MLKFIITSTFIVSCVSELFQTFSYQRPAFGTTRIAEELILDVQDIFWEYVKSDSGVQAGVRYLNSCSWLKLIRKLERHPKFKKLKVLLAKNGIMDLSYKKLLPLKAVTSYMANVTSGPNAGVEPDFSNLMNAIEVRMNEIPPALLHVYNLYYSKISMRIQESSTAGIIQHFLNDISTLPVSDIIFHELIRMSFNFHSISHLVFAMLSYNVKLKSQMARSPSIKEIAKYMDDGTLLTNLATDIKLD